VIKGGYPFFNIPLVYVLRMSNPVLNIVLSSSGFFILKDGGALSLMNLNLNLSVGKLDVNNKKITVIELMGESTIQNHLDILNCHIETKEEGYFKTDLFVLGSGLTTIKNSVFKNFFFHSENSIFGIFICYICMDFFWVFSYIRFTCCIVSNKHCVYKFMFQ
jgi:hypothetical protein